MGSLDQQLAQLASFYLTVNIFALIEDGSLTTHPIIPNELDNLTRICILVRGLRQPADDRLDNSLACPAPPPP